MGVATAPMVYLSARGQDTALMAAAVKARLESQGCLVRHGAAEVRTRSQCARHFGPLLHDCDVFIQLIGVDPGPMLSSEDEDDFWSLEIWEAREAARRKKPARHYLLDEAFCRMMLPDAKRPPQVLKKQERHRRKLASSPAKVREVRDADELLRLLPIIRLAGEPSEDFNSSPPAQTFSAELAATLEAIAQAKAEVEPVSRDAGPASQEAPATGVSVVPRASAQREVRAKEAVSTVVARQVSPAACEPSVKTNGTFHQGVANNDAANHTEALSVAGRGALSELPSFPENTDSTAVAPVLFENRRTELGSSHWVEEHPAPPPALPEVSLFHSESNDRKAPGARVPHAFVLETGSVLPPIPALPTVLEGEGPKEAKGAAMDLLPSTDLTAPPQVSDASVPPSPASSDAGPDAPVVAGRKAFTGANAAGMCLSSPVPAEAENSTAENSQPDRTELSPDVLQKDEIKSAATPASFPQAPSTPPTAAAAVVLAKASPALVDEQPALPKKSAVSEPFPAPREKMAIEAHTSRMEIVAQAPMKLELCRIEGHRVSVRPHAIERRGLPRRGLPAWMLKRSADHSSPTRPVPGRRAYAKPLPSENVESQDDGAEQPFEDTLFIPQRAGGRKYQPHRFIIFSFTDSITVRRLGEASKRKPGVAIAAGICVTLLVGLLAKVALDFLQHSSSPAVAPVASSDPALAAPSRLDVTAEKHKQSTAKPQKSVTSKQAVSGGSPPQVPVLAAITPANAKAGSAPKPLDSQPAPVPVAVVSMASTREIAPAPVGNLDEQQKALETALEEAILAMRKSSAGASAYARQHESTIIELQRKIQELIPIRSGHGFSGSASSLALSRCLASVHLLGGRKQAARNVLLDMRDTVATTRSAGDAEIRLADHLLKLTEPGSGTAMVQLPLTPGEMTALLAKLDSNPQWEPSTDGSLAGDN